MEDCMLTTLDNPFDPFNQFDEWFAFDVSKGHNTCGLLARIANTSQELSEADYDLEVDRAMNDIVKYDPLNLWIKVYRNSEKFKKN